MGFPSDRESIEGLGSAQCPGPCSGCAEKATEHNLLFEMLPKSAKAAIFGSLAPIGVLAGTDIITQGDEGTKFYILEAGCCDVLVAKEEWGPQPRKVLSYSPGRSVPAAAPLQKASPMKGKKGRGKSEENPNHAQSESCSHSLDMSRLTDLGAASPIAHDGSPSRLVRNASSILIMQLRR